MRGLNYVGEGVQAERWLPGVPASPHNAEDEHAETLIASGLYEETEVLPETAAPPPPPPAAPEPEPEPRPLNWWQTPVRPAETAEEASETPEAVSEASERVTAASDEDVNTDVLGAEPEPDEEA